MNRLEEEGAVWVGVEAEVDGREVVGAGVLGGAGVALGWEWAGVLLEHEVMGEEWSWALMVDFFVD